MRPPRPDDGPGAGAEARLRAALAGALRGRDRVAVSALRSALAAIGNAEAVSTPPAVAGPGGSPIAGAVTGLGAGEAQRRELTAPDVARIVQAEIDERLQAARDYERAGRQDRAERLRREATVLRSAAAGGGGTGHVG